MWYLGYFNPWLWWYAINKKKLDDTTRKFDEINKEFGTVTKKKELSYKDDKALEKEWRILGSDLRKTWESIAQEEIDYNKSKEEHITGAQKETTGKLRMDLIPPEAETALAEVLTFGAKKYSDRNWEKGLQFERHHLAAMYRHVNKWRRRIDNDEESGLNHLKHAMWHLMAIVTQIERGRTDLDDRGIVK